MFNVFLNFRIVAGGQNSSNSDHEEYDLTMGYQDTRYTYISIPGKTDLFSGFGFHFNCDTFYLCTKAKSGTILLGIPTWATIEN